MRSQSEGACPPRRNGSAVILAASILVAAAIAGIVGAALLQMRHDALENATESSTNLALTLERSITRNLHGYELSIRGVMDGMQDQQIMALPPSVRQRVVFDQSANAEDMGSLLAADANGDLLLDSRVWPPRPVNVADRDYFQAHLNSASAGIFLSRPFLPRLSANEMSIGISRRMPDVDGHFAGIVVGTLRINYFRNLFEGVSLGSGGTLTLARTDGLIVMRRPYDVKSIGRDISPSPSFAPVLQKESGTFIGVAAIDGVTRLYSYRHVPGYPLVVIVGLSVDDVLAGWHKRAWLFSTLVIVVDALILALSVMSVRQWRRRLQIEGHLRRLADTDGLTGLGSRRALDDVADKEWRRASREGAPLSLLMLDVDYFKRFNDRHGHLAGDDALASLARCIEQSIRRSGDYAGRYGGEEFAVLLPGTDRAGAVAVAEGIRREAQALAIENAASTFGVLTISIGVATMSSDGSDIETFKELRDFVRAADEALYQAKLAGRNRVHAYGSEDASVATNAAAG